MNWLDAIVKIIVALFGLCGVGLGVYFGYKQFRIKFDDEKQNKAIDLQISKAIEELRKEMMEELSKVSDARSEEGAKRFKTHAQAIDEINRQIEENSKQIGELIGTTQQVLASMDSINTVVKVSAESQRNSNYDRLLIVTNKILKSGKMTISDKTNLCQLYKSWKSLKGEDPKMDTMYDECLKIPPTLEET